MKREALVSVIEDLKAARTPTFDVSAFPCLSLGAYEGKEHISQDLLDSLISSLGPADIPTFERALVALDAGDLAWLGFKIVYDGALATANTDNEVTKQYGDTGSADGQSLVFFCNDAKEIVAGRPYSARDLFQMKDATRGPSMHNDQFEGLTWSSVALFDKTHVWLLGASDVAAETAALAHHVGFEVTVVDYDPAYLNPERFPAAERILLEGPGFERLDDLACAEGDFVCVLTRGHMFDPQSCVWAARHKAHYIGMMGCKGKNNRVYDLACKAGLSDEEWERIKRPIGLNFGAKTPAELAIAIVAELVDERYKVNYSPEARARHEQTLGR